jgi:hypothetical protein
LEEKSDDDILAYIKELKNKREKEANISSLEEVVIGQKVGLRIKGEIVIGKVLSFKENDIILISYAEGKKKVGRYLKNLRKVEGDQN